MSAWVKSGIVHNNTAGIIFSRGGTTTSGIHLGSNNELRYHWDGGKWSWSSGVFLPVDEWAHIALVVEPTKATIYLNGVPYVNSSTHNVEAFDAATFGTNAQKDLGGGVMGLWAADVNHDGAVNSIDITSNWTNRNQLNYHPSDVNFDGKTDAKDRSKVWNGRGVTEQLP